MGLLYSFTRHIVIASCVLGASQAFAGASGAPYTTFTISWSSSSQAVPTLGFYTTLLLAVFLSLAAYRGLKHAPSALRTLLPGALFAGTLSLGFGTSPLEAGIGMIPPDIEANNCSGSATYTADAPTPPPCFINTCGQPVTVHYTFVAAETFDNIMLTDATCERAYYCDAVSDSPFVAHGQEVPSDGQPYATAYCRNMFPSGPGGANSYGTNPS